MTTKVEDASVSMWDAVLRLAAYLTHSEKCEPKLEADVTHRALQSANALDDDDTGLHLVRTQLFERADRTGGG